MQAEIKVKPAEPKHIKYAILFYDREGNLFTRKEYEGDPAHFLPLPVYKNDSRIHVRGGELIKPYETVIFELIEVRRTSGFDFDEAIYREKERRPFDMTGVETIVHQHDITPEIMKIFNELNNVGGAHVGAVDASAPAPKDQPQKQEGQPAPVTALSPEKAAAPIKESA